MSNQFTSLLRTSFSQQVLDHLDGVDGEVNDGTDKPAPLDKATLSLHLPGEHLSPYDVARLILVVLLYVTVAAAGIVAIVYSVLAIISASGSNLRSVTYLYSAEYPPIGIAIIPDFSIYHGCFYRYFDDLAPPDSTYNPPYFGECNYTNVTFESIKLNTTRFAMVFKSPVHVNFKEILGVNFTINTTVRDYSAIEYWLIDDWNGFYLSSRKQQAVVLANAEETRPIHTFPAGMRTWVKMSKIIEKNSLNPNATFTVEPNFAKYTYRHGNLENGTDALQVLFEWESPVFEVYEVIPAISLWNAVGSLCGILIILWKVGEIGHGMFKRMRRERSKIKQRIKEKHVQKTHLMDEYLKSGTVPILPQGSKYKLIKSEPSSPGFETPPDVDSEYGTDYN